MNDADAIVVGTDQQAGVQPTGRAQRQVAGDPSRRSLIRSAVSHAARSAPVDGGFIFMLVHGSRSDWVQNVISTGMATLEIDGDTVALTGHHTARRRPLIW